MYSEIYSFEETMEILDNMGFGEKSRESQSKSKFRQLGDKCSSLHVRIRDHRYILYSTDMDFTNIIAACRKNEKHFIYSESKDKYELQNLIYDAEDNYRNAIVTFKNGNKTLHNKAESYLPNVVYFYTNENLEFILNVLKENKNNLK